MSTYKVSNINAPAEPRNIEADGFYYEEGTGAVCLYTGTRGPDEMLVARLYNVNVELVPAT